MDMKSLVIGGQRLRDTADRWSFDRAQYLNSSEADDCIRKIWYAKNGTPEAEQEWGFAWRGRTVETYVIDCLDARNDVTTRFTGASQVSYPDDKRRLSATPDGEISIEGGPWRGLEVKSIDPRTNRSNLPRSKDITQFKIAMALRNQTHADLDPLVEGDLMYVDASNYNDIVSFVVEAGDDAILDQYGKKATRVFRTKIVDNLDREGKRDGGCKYCPFTEACGVTLDEAKANRSRVRRGSNLDASAQEYMNLKDAADAAKARMDGLKEDIIDGLDGRSKVIVGNVEVTLQVSKGRETLDKKAVAAAGIDLSPFTKTGASSTRLTLKRVT